jgi:DHA1 family inner membrane transport protein
MGSVRRVTLPLTQVLPSHRSQTRSLAALALGAFAIGTAELVIIGILNLVARDTAVSISTAGQLVTSYALGIAVGAPVISALTMRFGRRMLLRVSLAAFVAGNALAVVATSFGLLLLTRVVTGSIHGLFIGVASVVAAGLVAPEHRGRAISMVFGGIAVSTVVGVPVGTLIGQTLGWRAAFGAVVVLGVLALVASLLFVPPVAQRDSGSLRAQTGAALAPRVLAMLGVGLVLLGGQFTAFTYLTPFLGTVTGISGGLVSAFLLAFGIAAAAGTFLGGRAADRSATGTLLAANGLLVLALGALYLVGSAPVLVVLALGLWGLVGFGLVPSFQLRVITLAGPGGDLGATLGASAVNAGIAGGSLIGGAVLAGHGAGATVLAAAILCAIALPATWATRFLTPPAGIEPMHAAPAQVDGPAAPVRLAG